MPETLKTIASFADLFSPFERTNALGQKPQGVMQYMPQQKPVSNSFLRQRYPQTYGFLGGLMGTAPDEFEGSVLDPLSAQVRQGAEIGFPIGTALQLAPLAGPAKTAARVGFENAMIPRTLNPQTGAIVWHGSPHRFDKFDASKIGTGEGAQAYGHGLYLAESPEVARIYSADRAYVGASMAGKPLPINYDDPLWIAQKTMDELGDAAKAKAHLEMVQRTAGKNQPPETKAAVQGAIDMISSGKVGTKGALYKVDLPDEQIAKMLDWDKPLSQQTPEVQALAKQYGLTDADHLGGDLVAAMNAKLSAGAETMRQAGIPGIRYLDQGSRGGGQGTSNFVVFPGNEGLLNILERNSVPMQQPFKYPQEKATAPVDPLGFYSAVEEAAMNMPRKSGQGQALLNDIMKGANVKADEVKWMGLDDFLAGKPNVTKQEVQDYIAANKVDVQEVTLGGGADVRAKADIDYAEGRLTRDEYNQILDSSGKPSKFGQYTLPGGENYREILLTLPQKPQPLPEGFNVDAYSVNGVTKYGVYDASGQRYGSGATKDEALKRFSEMHQDKPYKSSHWDQPNVLAHMRVNDRIDADGKKMLLIEEVQSDWHQAGRTKGYDTPERKLAQQKQLDDIVNERQRLLDEQKRIEDLAKPYTEQGKDAPANLIDQWNIVSNRLNALQTQQNRLGRNFGSTGVPDAPFKDTWYQLALKRAIKHAADNGYDRVGLTTGKRQIERYPEAMRQVADEIVWDSYARGEKALTIKKSGSNIFGAEVDNNGVIVRSTEPKAIGKSLQDVIGKQMADKTMGSASGEIKGTDFTVGGEGMKKYYDEIYPKFLDKYGKKWGAKVGETSISTERSRDASGIPSMYPQQEPIRYIDITPEMKASVSKGQPLFTAAPAIPAMSFGDLFNEPSDSQKELSFSDLFKAK